MASCWSARGTVAPFNDLQQRLSHKTVTPRMLGPPGACPRTTMLWLEADLRALPFDQRRARLKPGWP